ncbi:LysR family transcriptional regulator [Shimia biformata]|uniref:LysR family transcriptional regulator n=1 Tax=Shimia biformata TaxID=1294299 RepID=UPI001951A9AF|nr:LysR family transcriptional regulator [Shimia biformata]
MINFRTLDLNLLRVLDALLQDPSTTRAAASLGLSQSAVSAALGRLRHALSDPILIREGQALVPTDFARQIAPELQTCLHQIETLLTGPDVFDPGTETSSFKVSGSDYFSELLMPRLADLMAVEAPYMTVQQVDLVPDDYTRILEDSTIDLALIPRQDFPRWIGFDVMGTSGFTAVARTDHPRLNRASVKPGDTIPIDLFCDMGHVLFSPEGKRGGMGDAALARVGRERRVVMTLPVFSGVANAVASSDLIALLPTAFASRIGARLGLQTYDAPMETPRVELCMVWHQRSTNNPAHAWLRQNVLTIMRDVLD